jgi:hypothetical protein
LAVWTICLLIIAAFALVQLIKLLSLSQCPPAGQRYI